MQIPLELLEQIEQKNVVLFLGHNINLGEQGEPGLPALTELVQQLAERSDYPDDNFILARVAQHYEIEFGRHALINYIKRQWEASTVTPLASPRILARLPFRVIVTTCFDNRLERALREVDRDFVTVIRNADVAYEDENELLIVKIYGDLTQPDTMILTELDHRHFLNELQFCNS